MPPPPSGPRPPFGPPPPLPPRLPPLDQRVVEVFDDGATAKADPSLGHATTVQDDTEDPAQETPLTRDNEGTAGGAGEVKP